MPTAAVSNRLTFYSANGASETIRENVAGAIALLDYFKNNGKRVIFMGKGSYKGYKGYKGYHALLGSHLLEIYFSFCRMTKDNAGQEEALNQEMAGFIKDPESIRETLTFLAGAASDPWLYSADNEVYQQAAVANLYKAREIVLDIITHTT